MQRRTSIVAAATFGLVFVGGGAATATALDDDDGNESPDVTITGTALDRASKAALAHTGGGRVSDTEAGDEEGAYEVEVTRRDGSQVDVHLSEDFKVLGEEADSDSAEDEGARDGR